jgi:threonine dehydrogenase-like Zn-dependent dehydrogenase
MSGFRVMNSGPAISPHFNQAFRRAVPLMERGVFDLKPLVTHVVPVEQAQGLFETAVAHADGYIKGVVTW